MTRIDRGTLLELVRNRPLLAAELLGEALDACAEEPVGGEELRRRIPRLELTSADETALAARYREIMAEARRYREHLADVVFQDLIAFVRARIDEGLYRARRAANAGQRDGHKAERDLAAKRDRVNYLESVLVNQLYLALEEHAQAEHLLKLEAYAYTWHPDYREDWLP
ncbi:hypothetical protein JOL79_23825 [Microbispora sp. RL4-1S]|uniref:Uncharacterized protein n=1 Tax=Microbispora oryzae TaxID=2806554 RepID=A0A941AJX4_9ACTN|nr:hypothetical protein [Microbispora oryzae]MBP2706840.1 hypothetical protein [Microbispora oryzae]